MSELFDAAIDYAKRGFSVIPIKCKDKKPLIAWEQFQHRLVTEAEVKTWYLAWPEANVGIITGEISGLVVIDLDN
jgi:hypothetical protein